MNHEFDELAKGMAQSVTRRGALKKFGIGIAGIALAALRLTNNAHGQLDSRALPRDPKHPQIHCRCKEPEYGCDLRSPNFTLCLETCMVKCGP